LGSSAALKAAVLAKSLPSSILGKMLTIVKYQIKNKCTTNSAIKTEAATKA
jgi:hypothetical protein